MRDHFSPIVPRPATVFSDLATLRERARRNVERDAVTEACPSNSEAALRLLDEALATELVCALRYKRHSCMAAGIHAQGIAAEFAKHAVEELGHADQLAERIVQLGGAPNFDPDQLSKHSRAQYVEGKDLDDMLREDLVAERMAIGSYAEMIRDLGADDPTTRRMLEGILAVEEQHAENLIRLLRTQTA